MNKPLKINIGEHYQYCGSDYQIMDIRGDCVQLRSLTFSNQIVFQTYERLVHAWQTGGLLKTQEAPFTPRMNLIADALSPRQQAIMTKRLGFLLPVLEQWGGRLPRQAVLDLMAGIAAQTGEAAPSYGAVYLWKKAYLAMGENKLALVPKPRRAALHRVFSLPEEVQELIQINVDQLYFTRTPCSKTELTDAIICAISASNESRSPYHQLPIPSRSTLYRIITELDQYETDLHQQGYRLAIKRQKWSKKCPQPLERFDLVEGDTHELDVETCDQKGHLIGRLFLTALIEVRSRMIVGWDLSYNPPCAEKTLRALKHSLLSENLYGGLARRYRVDNGGEFVNARLKSTLQDLGSDVTYCEPGNPDQKPHIESFFKTWTTSIVHCMRGTTFSGPNPYDSEKNAIYTLKDVKKCFQNWLESVYHSSFHSGLGMSPREAWDEDQANSHGFALKKYSEDDLNRHLLCVTYITPNGGRLRFKGLAWTGPAVSYLATKCPGKRKSLRVLYDLCELGHAWVCDPQQTGHLYEVKAADLLYQTGLTMHLHQLIKTRLKIRKQSMNYCAAREARVQILREIANANTKGQRKRRQIAEEYGDFKSIPASPTYIALTKDERAAEYHFHPDTPSNYEIVVANHAT